MKFDIRAFSHVVGAIVGTIIPGVSQVEQLAWTLGGKSGREKQDDVVALVRAALTATNSMVGRQLAADTDVDAATRGVIDAVVALQKIVAKKVPAAALP